MIFWKIKVHSLVLQEDFKSIDPAQQNKILQTIQKKLTIDPESYGKPLGGEFKGYWRLRISDYRVVYRIIKDEVEVFVIKVGIRKDDKVYRELFARLRKIKG